MKITFRPVTLDDAEIIFSWLNDAETRAASVNTKPIVWKGHLEWLQKKMADPNYHLDLGEIDGDPVGYFRMEQCTDATHGLHGYVSYIIGPAHRGKGFGKTLVHSYVGQWPSMPIILDVRDSNKASIRIIQSLPGIVEIEGSTLEDGTRLRKFIRRPLTTS